MEALVRQVGNQKSGGTGTSGDYVVVVEEASLDECLALREENQKAFFKPTKHHSSLQSPRHRGKAYSRERKPRQTSRKER